MFSAIFNTLQSSMNQGLFKSASIIKLATIKNTDDTYYTKKVILCYHRIDTFCCQHSQQRWMEHTGKSMKNVLYKGTSWAEVMPNSKKYQARSPSHYRVTFVLRYQSVVSGSKILLNKLFLKFRNNFLKAFQVNLKAWFCFILIHCLFIIVWKNWGWFLNDFSSCAMLTPL